jgi:hypothetical protein
VAVLRGVRRLLHDEGYTIKGVQRLHKEEGLKRLISAGQEPGAAPIESDYEAAAPSLAQAAMRPERRAALETALAELEAARARLDALLRRS